MKALNVGDLIYSLRDTDPYIETIFMQGGCYKFHLFLKSIFKDAVPLINKSADHVVTMIGSDLWDINGAVIDQGDYQAITDSRLVESWSFSGNMILSLGECRECENPILVYPENKVGA